jgi:hypothetical protein
MKETLRFGAATLAATVAFALSSGAYAATTIGNAVTAVGGSDVAAAGTIGGAGAGERTTLVNLAGVGTTSDVIGYYIPLSGGACTFGVCGTSADSGTGGGPMSMFVEFVGVEGGTSFLNTWFEDLDLAGANDPSYFFEAVSIFGESGLLASFTSIANANVSGTAGTQQTTALALGSLLAGSTYTARYDFTSNYRSGGRNTPEFMLAAIQGTPAIPPVPLPAAGWLLIGALGGLAAIRRRLKA